MQCMLNNGWKFMGKSSKVQTNRAPAIGTAESNSIKINVGIETFKSENLKDFTNLAKLKASANLVVCGTVFLLFSIFFFILPNLLLPSPAPHPIESNRTQYVRLIVWKLVFLFCVVFHSPFCCGFLFPVLYHKLRAK